MLVADEVKQKRNGTLFVGAALVVLFAVLAYGIRVDTTELDAFTAECKALNGKIARMGERRICIDPSTILKEQEHYDRHDHN